MTLLEMLEEGYDECAFRSTPATQIQTRFKRWINRGLEVVLSVPGRTKLREVIGLSFATVASTKYYGLPAVFERIDRVYTTTDPRVMALRDQEWVRANDPSDVSSGAPWVRVECGIKPVGRQPASSGVWAVSSEAADTGAVKYRGILANGQMAAAGSTALSGTTRVQLGTLTTYVEIVQFNLAAAQTGTVELYDAAVSGNLLARIPIGDRSARYHINRLWPTPSAVETVYVDGQIEIPKLVNDTDTPPLPLSFHDLPVLYATARHWKKQGDRKRFDIVMAEFSERNAQLTAMLDYPADWRGMTGQDDAESARWNNLGGSFPADGYGD